MRSVVVHNAHVHTKLARLNKLFFVSLNTLFVFKATTTTREHKFVLPWSFRQLELLEYYRKIRRKWDWYNLVDRICFGFYLPLNHFQAGNPGNACFFPDLILFLSWSNTENWPHIPFSAFQTRSPTDKISKQTYFWGWTNNYFVYGLHTAIKQNVISRDKKCNTMMIRLFGQDANVDLCVLNCTSYFMINNDMFKRSIQGCCFR